MLGDSHKQELGNKLNEESPDPRRHFMCRWFPVMDVEDDRRHEHGEADEGHGKEEVLSQERHCQGRRRDVLQDEEEKHGLGENDGDDEDDLLTRVCRQVEDEDCQVRNPDSWHNEVHSVKERLPTEGDVKKYICQGEQRGGTVNETVGRRLTCKIHTPRKMGSN